MIENQKIMMINLQYSKEQFPKSVAFYKSNSLENGFKAHFYSKGIRPTFKYVYLKKNGKIIGILNPKRSVDSQIPLGKEYIVFLSNEVYQIKTEQENTNEKIYNIKNDNNMNNSETFRIINSRNKIITNDYDNNDFIFDKKINLKILDENAKKEKLKKKYKYILIISLISLIIIFLTTFLVIYLWKRKKKKEKEKEKERERQRTIMLSKINEKLKANVIYNPGEIYLFNSIGSTKAKTEGQNISEENSTYEFTEFKNYILMINNEFVENYNNCSRLYYRGFFALINSYLDNGTHLILSESNNKLINILEEKKGINLSLLNDGNIVDYSLSNDSNITNPFFMLDFYRNGKIKNIYTPQNFNLSKMIDMKFLLNLTIPKIFFDNYVNNIDEEINKYIENKTKEEEKNLENNTYYYNENFTGGNDSLRFLNSDENRNFSNEASINSNYKGDELISLNLMQSNTYISENNETMNEIKEVNYGNLNDEFYAFEGSALNSSVTFIVNEKSGKIKSINQIEELILSNQTESEPSEDDPVYDDNNEIKISDIRENMTTKTPDIELSTFSVNKTKNINCSYINDDYIFRKLNRYFDSFYYSKFDENKNNDINLRLLTIKENFIRRNKLNENDVNIELISNSKKRKSSENKNIKYCGLNNFITSKEIYEYNLMGIKMNEKAFAEIEPSTGKLKKFVDITFGKMKTRINFKDSDTNLNIIIQNSNKLIYKMIELILRTNNFLQNKNEEYSNQILEIEKNITNLLTDFEDFSNILKDPLNNMYDKIKNFSTDLFKELFILITNIHSNYTFILNNVREDKYEIFNKIRDITKYEYINYANTMTNILEDLHNETLVYINNIKNELGGIAYFLIDYLYDIIDSINDCTGMFGQFTKKLFLSIERGIILFRYDLDEFIGNEIGDLLYVTEFLSVNLNKNEILKKSIDEKERNEIIILLRDFRNIINIIIEKLVKDIYDDYENEISDSFNNSIKNNIEKKVENYLSIINSNSEELINEIKQKIEFFNLYMKFSNVIDMIDKIHNKTIYEFNFDYNTCLKNMINIMPDFYKINNSEIIVQKDRLFDISLEIKEKINEEIIEIDEYIENYSNNFFKTNLYDMQKSIYYFKKLFENNEMISLVNEYEKLINYIIETIFKNNMKYNYDLMNQYLQEELSLLIYYRSKWHYYSTTGFDKRAKKFLKVFEDYFALTQSEEFMSLIEKYFYKIKNEILNYINEQLNSIDEYYFNDEIYKKKFFYIEQINEEILKISNNINNYYNNIKLNTELKVNAITLSQEKLYDYNEEIIDKFTDLYTDIKSRGAGAPRNIDPDFEYWTWKYLLGGWRKKYVYCNHYQNINKVINNLKDIDEYLSQNSDIIINNFIRKFDKYLSNYVTKSKYLYKNLYEYVEDKKNNNDNIDKIFVKYEELIKDIKLKNGDEELIIKLNNNNNLCPSEYFINNLEKNINLIKDNFSNNLLNESELLEYPKEIIPKLNQILNQLKKEKESIKEIINLSFIKKIFQVVEQNSKFINDINHYNKKYVLSFSNFSNTIQNYSYYKSNYISKTFSKFNTNISLIEEKNNNLDKMIDFENNSFVLNKNNFDFLINETMINISDFVSELQNEINNIFFFNENITNTTNETFNYINYSSYNFNIVKLRSSVYYSKNQIINLYNLFDDFEFNYIINDTIIDLIDNYVNDKNIFEIYNETNKNLKSINIDTDKLLKNVYDEYIEDFKEKFSFENDYFSSIEKFKTILNFSSMNFIKYINATNKNIYSSIKNIIYEFNEILNNQLNLTQYYDYYNINNSYFEGVYDYYKELVQNIFNKNRDNIYNIKKDYNFYNMIKDIIFDHINHKIEYSKNNINDFLKDFEIKFLNYSFDLGEYTAKYMKKEYLVYIFKYIYDYVEFFENNTERYINELITDLENLENYTISQLNYTYNLFYEKLSSNISSFITEEYIIQLNENRIKCENYSIDKLEEYKVEDELNYEKYIISLIETSSTDNFLSDAVKINFFNKTDSLLNCVNNNYYNYSVFVFQKFDPFYKDKLDSLINKFINIIENNNKNISFLFDFVKNEITFNEYTFSLTDITPDFLKFKDMNIYINNSKNKEYKEIIQSSLILNYKESYFNFINDYLSDFISSNIDLIINEKIRMNINSIINKIIEDFQYYQILLNDTDSFGISTKRTFLELYRKLEENIKNIVIEGIEDNIIFNLKLFCRDKKKLFINNYLNYYSNKNDIKIYKLDDYFFEIISEKSFNKTLEEYTDNIFNETINHKINDQLDNYIFKILEKFTIFINSIKEKMEIILNNITIEESPDDMNQTIVLIEEFNTLLDNQRTKYNFIVSEKPFLIINQFINDNLEPPLIEIKDKYNQIEEELLNKIINILDSFPDYFQVVKNNLNIESKISNIAEGVGGFKSYLYKYFNDFNENIDEYYNKLAYLTIINGSNYLEEPCNLSICFLISSFAKNNKRILNENQTNNIDINNYLDKTLKLNIHNKTYFKFKRKMQFNGEKYGTNSPPLSQQDLLYFIQFINETLSQFSTIVLSEDFNTLNYTHEFILNKLQNIIIPKIKYSVDLTAVKFSTIITKDNYEILLSKLNFQYNKIKDFVNINYTESINNAMNNFLNSVNNTYTFTDILNKLGFNKIIEISDKFQELINEKLSSIIGSNNELNDLINTIKKLNNSNLDENFNNTHKKIFEIVSKGFDKAQNALNKIEENIKKPIKSIFNIIDSISNNFYSYSNIIKKYLGPEWNYDFFLWLGYYAIEGKKNTYIHLLSFDMYIDKILIDNFLTKCKGFEYLQVRPYIYLLAIEIHLDVELNFIYKDENKYLTNMKDIQISISFSIGMQTYIQCQAGLFIPIGIGEMYITFGLDGVLADAEFNSLIRINLIKNSYLVALKFYLNVVAFLLYLKLGFYIDLKLFSIRFDFYLWYILIPLYMPISVDCLIEYSFRNKLLANSYNARLSLFNFIPIGLNEITKSLINDNLLKLLSFSKND